MFQRFAHIGLADEVHNGDLRRRRRGCGGRGAAIGRDRARFRASTMSRCRPLRLHARRFRDEPALPQVPLHHRHHGLAVNGARPLGAFQGFFRAANLMPDFLNRDGVLIFEHQLVGRGL